MNRFLPTPRPGAQTEIEVYLTFGLSIYTPEEEAEAARADADREQGFRTFKLQGIDDQGDKIAPAAERVRRLREVVGDDRGIILDGHNNYNVYQGIELAKAIEPYGMTFFDEPLFAKDAASACRPASGGPPCSYRRPQQGWRLPRKPGPPSCPAA